jgi:AI-2 transport protein TqsA
MYDPRISNQYMLNVIGVLMVFTAMNYARPVLVPFFLACFLAITIQPSLKWLSGYVPRWVSAILVTLLLLVAIVGGSSMFVADVLGVAGRTPEYAIRFKSMAQGALDFAARHGLKLSVQDLGTSEGLAWIFKFLTDGLSSAFGMIAETVLVLFMMVFLLMEGDEFRRKIARSFTNHTSDMMLDSIDSIVSRIQTYMITKTVISLATGVCTSLLTWIMGVEFPLLWGTIAFLLNFIPNVGSIIAVIPPVIIAFLQFEHLTPGLVCLIGLTVVQMTIGNVIEPRVMAHSLDLSTLVVFVSMIFWGWLWGMVGILLAVPLTAAIKIICEHIEGLHPLAIILGERSESVPRDVPLISSAALPSVRPPTRANADKSGSRPHLEPATTPRRSITLSPDNLNSFGHVYPSNALSDWSASATPAPGGDPRVLARLFGAPATAVPVPTVPAPAAAITTAPAPVTVSPLATAPTGHPAITPSPSALTP